MSTARKPAYLKPIRYRVTMRRIYGEHGVAQESGTVDYAFRKVWNKYADKYLPTIGHKKKAVLCYRTTKMLLGQREKPKDRLYHVHTNCHLAGVTVMIEAF